MATPAEGYPYWATNEVVESVDGKTYTNKVRPPQEVQDSGLLYQEPMARAWFNDNFNLIRKWIEELDIRTTGGSVQTGWIEYQDTTYTVGSPLTVSASTEVAIPNNGGTIVSTGAPANGDTFWNGTIITADNDGDAFLLGLRFKATSTTTDAEFAVSLDKTSIIAEDSRVLIRGASTEHEFIFNWPFHVDSTFITNGGTPKIEAITGNIDIYDISFFIQRTYYKDNT